MDRRGAANAAAEVLLEMCLRWNERRHTTDLLAADFVREDRRSVTGMPDADRSAFADVEKSMWALGARWPSEIPVIASAGDRLVLSEGRVSFGDGASWLEYLTILVVSDDGLAQRLILFEPEQRAEAEAEFRRLAA